MAKPYPGAQIIEASAVSAWVDEDVARTKETQLISTATGRRTVHLETNERVWAWQSNSAGRLVIFLRHGNVMPTSSVSASETLDQRPDHIVYH